MTVFDLGDSWQEMLDYGWPINVALGEDPDEQACDIMVHLRSLGDVTAAEAVAALDDDAGMRGAIWFLVFMKDAMTEALEDAFVVRLCANPVWAAVTFVSERERLSQRLWLPLWNSFDGPNFAASRARLISDGRGPSVHG